MGKSIRKQPAPRKSKNSLPCLTYSALTHLVKTKLIRKPLSSTPSEVDTHQIRELVNEDVLTCAICLQLLLSPVLTECGHSFCLACAEDLANNGFSCGICHSHQPNFDLPNSSTIETLIEEFLLHSECEEKHGYQKRRVDLQKKQEKRRIGEVARGDSVDYWSEEENVWKSGIVEEVLKNTLILNVNRRGADSLRVEVNCTSRKLAPYRYYTKEEPQEISNVQIRPPWQILQGDNFQRFRFSMNNRINEGPNNIITMPYIFGLYWRGNDEMIDRSGFFDPMDPFNL